MQTVKVYIQAWVGMKNRPPSVLATPLYHIQHRQLIQLSQALQRQVLEGQTSKPVLTLAPSEIRSLVVQL
jgi:hypothetical protein